MALVEQPHYNVYIGSETGLLKGVQVDKKKWHNINTLEHASRSKEILAMCWGNATETEVCLGLRDKTVLSYQCDTGQTEEVNLEAAGDGALRGLTKYDGNYLTCVESGLLKVWTPEEEEKLEVNVGADVWRMRQNPWQPNLVATGGKENGLKIWDLQNSQEPIFKAKNVKHDFLNLRVPVWMMDAAFIPESQKVVTCTGHHQIRMYDPLASQRRPVMDIQFDEYPITTLSLRPSSNQVVIGNTQGKMALVDFRKGRVVQCYKGFAGAIRCIQCHPTLPLVASCGLDRYLRIHDIDSKALLHKFYLKSRLNCLLMPEKWEDEKEDNENEEGEVNSDVELEEDDSGNDSFDEIWEKMDIVEKKAKRKTDNETQAGVVNKKKHSDSGKKRSKSKSGSREERTEEMVTKKKKKR